MGKAAEPPSIVWVSHRGDLGGAELALAEGVAGLATQGYNATVVLPWSGTLSARLPANQTVIIPSNPWLSVPNLGVVAQFRRQAHNVARALPSLVRLLRQRRASVVISNTLGSPVGAFAAAAVKVPHVWFLHEHGLKTHGIGFVCGTGLALRAVGRFSDAFLVNSMATANWASAEVSRRVPSFLARYAVDLPGAAALARAKGAPTRFLIAGWISPGKGQHEAVAAIASLSSEHRDVRLTIAGDGPRETLQKIASELGITERVEYLPFQGDALALYAQVDAVLVCSRDEGLGRVAIEAMKCGRPVIAAASGATVEHVVENETGFLYPPGDVSALARKIEWVRTHPDRVASVVDAARGRAESEFNSSSYTQGLVAALRAVAPSIFPLE